MLLWIYWTIFSSFQFDFRVAELKQKLGCLLCGSSPVRGPSTGAHDCNKYKRQEEREKAGISLSPQWHHSMCIHILTATSATIIISRTCLGQGKTQWFDFNNCIHNWLGFAGEQQLLSLTSFFVHPNKFSHFPSLSGLLITAFSHPPKTCFLSTRKWAVHMLRPSLPAFNRIVFLCSQSSHSSFPPLRLQPCASPRVPWTAVGICKPANDYFVKNLLWIWWVSLCKPRNKNLQHNW